MLRNGLHRAGESRHDVGHDDQRDAVADAVFVYLLAYPHQKERAGGQQQRLTIARALSHQPEILCLDEFSIAVDPVTTMRIEYVLKELRSKITIILVTNLVQQARRLGDRTAFLFNGELIEIDSNEVIFSDAPKNKMTYDYVIGNFG